MQPSIWQAWADYRNRRGVKEPAEALVHCACSQTTPVIRLRHHLWAVAA